MQERRKHRRRRSYLGGQVAFGQRCCVLDCLVRNLSHAGARLVFSNHAPIPDEFDLTIPHKGDSRRARIIWRHRLDLGVHFLESNAKHDDARPSIETARRIALLKQLNAALTSRVADLSQSAY